MIRDAVGNEGIGISQTIPIGPGSLDDQVGIAPQLQDCISEAGENACVYSRLYPRIVNSSALNAKEVGKK